MPKILEKFKNLFSNKFIYKPKKKSTCKEEESKQEERAKEQKQ